MGTESLLEINNGRIDLDADGIRYITPAGNTIELIQPSNYYDRIRGAAQAYAVSSSELASAFSRVGQTMQEYAANEYFFVDEFTAKWLDERITDEETIPSEEIIEFLEGVAVNE